MKEVTWFDFCQWARAAGVSDRVLSRWGVASLELQALFLSQLSQRVH